MSNDEYSANARELAYNIDKAASDKERVLLIDEFFKKKNNLPGEVVDNIKEDLLRDIKNGVEYDAYEEIRDELRDEIEDELQKEFDDLKNKELEIKNSWVLVRDKAIDTSIRAAIDSLILLLDVVKTDNSISGDESALSYTQKEQLIAVLKSVLIELEAPYIHKGKITNVRNWLFTIGKRVAEKKLSSKLSDVFDRAQENLGDLSDKIKDFDGGPPF